MIKKHVFPLRIILSHLVLSVILLAEFEDTIAEAEDVFVGRIFRIGKFLNFE